MFSPLFHSGERAVQLRAGEVESADHNASIISPTIHEGARGFVKEQFMVVFSSVDGNGNAWSSILYGIPGFIRTIGQTVVAIDVPIERRIASDPLWGNLRPEAAIGILLIDIGHRRRYRINGKLIQVDEVGLKFQVSEAFPNCPKFIQRRRLMSYGEQLEAYGSVSGRRIAGTVQALIRQADTMFLASYFAETGADASHRGGERGFIQVEGPYTLKIPDYPGNSMFNTFGNLLLNSQIGVCIPDFEGGHLLQLTGRAQMLWGQHDPDEITGGTGRYLQIEISQWILSQVPQLLEWEDVEPSPFNPPVVQE